MPLIEIKMYEGRTQEQKQELVEKITAVFEEVADAPRDHVWIVFRDVPRDQWGMGGELQG